MRGQKPVLTPCLTFPCIIVQSKGIRILLANRMCGSLAFTVFSYILLASTAKLLKSKVMVEKPKRRFWQFHLSSDAPWNWILPIMSAAGLCGIVILVITGERSRDIVRNAVSCYCFLLILLSRLIDAIVSGKTRVRSGQVIERKNGLFPFMISIYSGLILFCVGCLVYRWLHVFP